jgi:hypothetical protein
MVSGAVMYVPSFVQIGSDTYTHRQQDDLISLLYFFKIRLLFIIRLYRKYEVFLHKS